MEITEVKVFPVSEEKLKAFVSVVFDRCFMVNDIKIIQGRDGLFISMPSRKKKNGEFKDVAHPLNNDTRRMIETEVVEEYERVLAERGESLPAPPRTFPDADDSEADGSEAADDEGRDDGRRERPAAAPVPSPPPATREVPGAGARQVGQPEAPQPIAAAATSGGEGAAPEAAVPVAAAEAKPEEKKPDEKSLEEVQEMHLRDSFWSVS